MKRLALLLCLAAGCNDAFDGTAVRVTLTYGANLGLDGVEVIVDTKTETAGIAPELFLTLPDSLAGKPVSIKVWGDKAGQRVVSGLVEVTPKRNAVTPASISLEACMPGCDGNVLTSCVVPPGACPTSCIPTVDVVVAHCEGTTPSNLVPSLLAANLTGMTKVPEMAMATIDTDTGAISGGLTRAEGGGVDAGIGYYQLDPVAGKNGVPLAVFAFNNLELASTGILKFTGTRAPVLLIAHAGQLDGTIDLDADQAKPGVGGFAAASDDHTASGCGRGDDGRRTPPFDSGGGGAGGGSDGAPGGMAGTLTASLGGLTCLPVELEPLQGGSGGGRGSPGIAASAPLGGAGGGAIQISALDQLTVTGTIAASGGGGESGTTVANGDAASGGGGGGGGGILLEAPMITVTADAHIVVNGGGGGGGGGPQLTTPGDNGGMLLSSPNGGAGGATSGGTTNNGGTGGDLGPPDVGLDGDNDSGGGGGSYGLIVVRGNPGSRSLALGQFSMRLVQRDLKP